jgi:hypothetical protein
MMLHMCAFSLPGDASLLSPGVAGCLCSL